MKNNNQTLKIILFLSIIVTLGIIVYIMNKNGTIVEFSSSLLALLGSGIGLGLSFLLKKATIGTSKRKVFLSYNMNDRDFAMRISSDLKENEIIVFDENEILKPGDTLNKII